MGIFVLLYAALLLPPPLEGATIANVDQAWAFVLQWEHIHRGSAGAGLIFTYGPLGWIWSLDFARYPGMSFGAVGLAVAVRVLFVGWGIWRLTRPRPLAAALLGGFLIANAMVPFFADVEMLIVVLAVTLSLVRNEAGDAAGGRGWEPYAVAGALLAFYGWGKFTWLVASGFAATVLVVATLRDRQWRQAGALVLGGVVVTMIVAGASPAGLIRIVGFVEWGFEVAGGFTINMTLEPGPGISLSILSLAGATFIIFAVREAMSQRWRAVPGVLTLGVFIFLSTQMSLTRADPVHAKTGAFFCAGAMLLSLVSPGIKTRGSGALAWLAGVICIGALFFGIHLDGTVGTGKWAERWQAWRRIGEWEDKVQRQATEISGSLGEPNGAEQGKSFDVLGNQQVVIAGLGAGRYTPRPVFQSYSAYTPRLAQANLEWLAATPPDQFWLGFFPIDGRLLAMEDGPLLFELLQTWEVTGAVGGYAVFSRGDRGRRGVPVSEAEPAQTVRFGEWVPVNSTDHMVFLQVSGVNAGSLPRGGRRHPLVGIVVRYADGTQSAYRLPPGMGEAGFVISPRFHSLREIFQFKQAGGAGARAVAFAIFVDSVDSQPTSELSVRLTRVPTGETGKSARWNFLPLVSAEGVKMPEFLQVNGREGLVIHPNSTVRLGTDDAKIRKFSGLVGPIAPGTPARLVFRAKGAGDSRILGSVELRPKTDVRVDFERVEIAPQLGPGESLEIHVEDGAGIVFLDPRFELERENGR